MKFLVLAAAVTGCSALQKWCLDAPQSGWPVCDPTAPLDTRAADIVSRISLTDKIQLLSAGQYPGSGADKNGIAAPSIGLDTYNVWSEAAHGLLYVNYSAELSGATNTALPITVSSSFNRSLWGATGNTIGREARAFMNANAADSTFWAPGACAPLRPAYAPLCGAPPNSFTQPLPLLPGSLTQSLTSCATRAGGGTWVRDSVQETRAGLS